MTTRTVAPSVSAYADGLPGVSKNFRWGSLPKRVLCARICGSIDSDDRLLQTGVYGINSAVCVVEMKIS